MKKIFIAVIIGIFAFFLLEFVQHHEIFIQPLFQKEIKEPEDRDIKTTIEVVRTFNHELEKFYKNGDTKKIDNIIDDKYIINTLLTDYKFYIKEGKQVFLKLKEMKSAEPFVLGERQIIVPVWEEWEVKISAEGKVLKTNNQVFENEYTLFKKNDNWEIRRIEIKNVYEKTY